MSKISPRYRKQGEAAEAAFAAWLNRSALPYIYVEQSPLTVPDKLKGSIKRPDYIVGLPMIGNVSCDVKAKSFYDDKLIFDEYEFRNLANFQRFFNSSVWLVCYPPDDLTTCYLFMNEWLMLEPLQEVRGQNCVYMPATDMLKIDTEKLTFREALMQATDLA